MALPRGLNIAAGWVLLLGLIGSMNGTTTSITVLLLLLASRQISSGNVFRTAPFTFGLCSAIVATFCAMWVARGDAGVDALAHAGALTWPTLCAGELWRLPATVFLHGDWHHLWSNTTWMLGIGLLLEPAIGTRVLMSACAFTLVTSTAVELFLEVGGYGASGVLYGIEGVMLARPLRTTADGRRMLDWAWALLALALLYDIPYSQNDPTIGFAAHLGGLAGGLWFGCVWTGDRGGIPRKRVSMLRWSAATALALALLAAEALNPRWPLDWHARVARNYEQAGNLKAAGQQWAIVESLADVSEPVDADKLETAAGYWARRDSIGRTRRLLTEICATKGAEEYNDLGAYQAFVDPPDERAALESWEQSLTLNPHSAEVLDRMAYVRLFPSDSTLYSPTAAVYLARCAVEQDRFQTPDYVSTLALAEDRMGHRTEAIRLMKRALALAPEDSTEYLEELAAMEGESVKSSDPAASLR